MCTNKTNTSKTSLFSIIFFKETCKCTGNFTRMFSLRFSLIFFRATTIYNLYMSKVTVLVHIKICPLLDLPSYKKDIHVDGMVLHRILLPLNSKYYSLTCICYNTLLEWNLSGNDRRQQCRHCTFLSTDWLWRLT